MASFKMHHNILITTLILAICIETSLTKSAKNNARPVHETIQEHSRSDQDISRSTKLPYGNPLAGSQNARQHAQHQQAMFNAERNRQHKAQVQRWTTAPQQMDSYMKAYHETQESHHLALERQQAKIKDGNHEQKSKQFTPITPTPAPLKQKQQPIRRPEIVKRVKNEPGRKTEPSRKVEVRTKQDKNRNHRSYGSADYHANPSIYQNYYEQSHEQGVTIKPNGNIGLSQGFVPSPENELSKLYTEAIPSRTQYVYPKQYNQMQGYQSAQDIAALSSLLKKNPHDQLSELSALLQSTKQEEEHAQDHVSEQQPIDLFFYLKDNPAAHSLTDHYDQSKYAQLPQTYAQTYANHEDEIKDHTPITEEIDDIADPNKPNTVTSYGIQPVLTPHSQILPDFETTTIKSSNYYKVEVASQTISSGYKPSYVPKVKQPVQYVLQDHSEEDQKPTYQALNYGQQYSYQDKDTDSGDTSERYLHHNGHFTSKGVQHLTGDGTGVSAYGEDAENLHYAAQYEFGYRVRDNHSGNDFGHHEAKSGEKTNGHYHVLLPDGRLQQVKYWAGPSGFHADISYDHLHEQTHE